MNLYLKILNVASDVKNIGKNMTVGTGGSSYKAVSDFDVVMAVKDAEKRHGIVSLPVKQDLVDSQVVTVKDKYGNDKIQYVDIVKMTCRLINVDDPNEFVEVESYGRGIDSADKGFGKASTYARKYCLLNAYKIATGEDPDKDVSEETSPSTKPVTSNKKKSPTNKQLQSCVDRALKGEQGIREALLKNFAVTPDTLAVYDLAVKEGIAIEEAMDRSMNEA